MKTLRLFLAGTLATSLLAVVPAAASDGDHGGPGATGPDLSSQNVKLLANVPRSAAATQSDMAFFGKYVVAGNYVGFRIIDVSVPESPQVVTDFRCNGAQGDVSVMGDLLFQSVDSPQSHGGCDSANVTASTPGMFEGIRIFDISDVSDPVHVTSIPTACGSHTHTLLPEPENNRAILYVSSYPLGSAALGPDCVRAEDGGGHSKISIVEVPADDPAAAQVHEYQLDEDTEWATYLGAYTFRACHDMSLFKDLGLLAAACLSEGQLLDISDPLAPDFIWRYDNPNIKPENIDLFHSATFSWDGTMVAFGDESGGGGAARCTDPDDGQGRIWFLTADTGEELGSYKIPRSEDGTCTMHNFNFLPRRDGKNVLVSAAYTGGTTIVDVDKLLGGASAAEAEVGFFRAHGGNAWSSYWYNGHIYANDILRGVDILLLSDKARAATVKLDHLNPQTQISVIGD
ncbi:MAG TPA: hypothetical protein VFZ72_23035 [Jiangellaceae bacterium]